MPRKRPITIIAVFIFLLSLFSPVAFAQRVFQNSLWESQRLKKAITSLAWLTLDAQPCLVALSHQELTLYRIQGTLLAPLSTLPATRSETFYRVHTVDFDGDAQMDVVINGYAREHVFSHIYSVSAGKLVLRDTLEALVVPLTLHGHTRLYQQLDRGHGVYSRAIQELTYQQNRFVPGVEIPLREGMGGLAESLFQVSGLRDKLVLLTNDQRLRVQDVKGAKLWQGNQFYGGAFDYVEFTSRDALGLSRQTRFFIDPRLSFDSSSGLLAVIRNDGYLKNVVGAVPSMKSGQVMLMEWGGAGLQERLAYPKLDGAVSDVLFADFDGNGTQELVVSFLVRASGYFDSWDGLQSLIAVLPVAMPVVLQTPAAEMPVPSVVLPSPVIISPVAAPLPAPVMAPAAQTLPEPVKLPQVSVPLQRTLTPAKKPAAKKSLSPGL